MTVTANKVFIKGRKTNIHQAHSAVFTRTKNLTTDYSSG